MSLDVKKLEKVRELANGVVQARCPACAEAGGDRTGEHLRVYADGRYGCCVHPKDREHRKRIFALAGEQRAAGTRGQFRVKVAVAARPAAGEKSVREALECRMKIEERRTGGEREQVECEAERFRTVRTGDGEWADADSFFGDEDAEWKGDVRTVRTPVSNPRAYASEECDGTRMYKDCENGVLSVLKPEAAASTGVGARRERVPFFTADGTLSIPFDSPERYHWWKPDGQRLTLKEIVAEVRARKEEVEHGAAF